MGAVMALARTMVIGIASGTTTMTGDTTEAEGAMALRTPRQLATTPTVVASAVRVDSPSRMACVSHIVATNSSSSRGRRSGRPLLFISRRARDVGCKKSGGSLQLREYPAEMVRLSCEKCGRDGCYGLHRLIERRGRDAKLIDWLDELTADCAKKRAGNMNDPCGAK